MAWKWNWWDKGSGYPFVINILCFEGKILRCHLIITWNSSHVLGTVCVLATHPSRNNTGMTEGCPGGHLAMMAHAARVSCLPDTVPHVLTPVRYLSSVGKCTAGPRLQSYQTTKSTTYDCAKIRKPKLDSEPSCEIRYLIFFTLRMGKLRHRERSKWQS